jgi:hypothetical protein
VTGCGTGLADEARAAACGAKARASRLLTTVPRLIGGATARGVVFVFAALLASIAGHGDSGATSHEQKRLPRSPAVAVSPSGNDVTCARGKPSRPCRTFDGAYRRARCGDVVEVRTGIYGVQILYEVSSLSSCARNVTFQAAAGSSVSVEAIGFGDGIGSKNAPDRITLKNFTVRKHVNLVGDVEHVTLEGINGGGFFIQGVNNVRIRGGDWGPCHSSGPSECRAPSFINEDSRLNEYTRNVTIDGATLHDYRITADGDHFECLFTTGGSNVTIRNSRFYNCETYAIATGARDWATYKNWVIENNWFGRTCCFGTRDRSSAIMFGGDVGVSNMLIRFNTFIRGQGVVQEGHVVGGNNRIVNNILTQTGCIDRIRYRGNLFAGATCSTADVSAVYGYRFNGARLRVDGPRGKAVQAAYASVADGTALRSTARALARTRRPSPPGGWNVRTLRHLLTDDVYLGRRLGRQQEHAPLVSSARWRHVQRVLEGKVRRRR